MTGHKFAWWQRQRLQKQLRQTHDVRVYRRTLALLDYDRGEPVSGIAERLGVQRRSIYYWIAAFGQASDPAALQDAPRSGRPADWTEQTTRWLEKLLASSPKDWGFQAVNWTMPLLGKALAEHTGHQFSRNTIRRGLRQLDEVWKRPRYGLQPDPEREEKTPDSLAIAPAAGP